MDNLYKIYSDRLCNTKYCNQKLRLSYSDWFFLVLQFRDEYKKTGLHIKDVGQIFVSEFMGIDECELIDLGFNIFMDGGGIRFRSEILLNNNDLIDNFNRVLNFLK